MLEPNYLFPKFFPEDHLAIKIEKTEILMNKPFHPELSVLELSKILLYGYQYDYVKPKYGGKAELCHVDTDSFTVYIKKKMIFTKSLQKMLKQDFKLQIFNQTDHFLKDKMKK